MTSKAKERGGSESGGESIIILVIVAFTVAVLYLVQKPPELIARRLRLHRTRTKEKLPPGGKTLSFGLEGLPILLKTKQGEKSASVEGQLIPTLVGKLPDAAEQNDYSQMIRGRL